MNIHLGQRVRFNIAGRFPKPAEGVVVSLDTLSPEKGWGEVECSGPAGPILRKVRPKSMTPIT